MALKIAVAYQDGEIHGHFGHCETFAIYEYGQTVADCSKRLVSAQGRAGHEAMAELMREQGVDAVICGNMGGEAKALLLSYGIVPVIGYSGHADTASDLLATGQLPIAPGGGCSCGGSCGCGSGTEEDCSCGGGCSCGCGGDSDEDAQ